MSPPNDVFSVLPFHRPDDEEWASAVMEAPDEVLRALESYADSPGIGLDGLKIKQLVQRARRLRGDRPQGA